MSWVEAFTASFPNSAAAAGVPLAEHTTFRIGGPARLFAEPADVAELAAMVAYASSRQLPLLVLGKGSNLLVSDDGFDGLVLHLGRNLAEIRPEGPGRLYAQAGAELSRLCKVAQEQSLSGLEFAFGIPGSVGGAIYMNAGAYGGEVGERLLWADCIDPQGQLHRLPGEELAFSYRHSLFAENGWVVAGGCFALTPGQREQIGAAMEAVFARRREKQPLEYPSAGSTFKRPSGAFAAALIDQCGLKGRRVGGAMVSPKHAGFIVNDQNATCRDVLALIGQVRQTVQEQTGYLLECEVKFV